MPTQVGDIVPGANGEPREVIEVESADDWIARMTDAYPTRYRLGSSSGERCSLYGTTKRTTKEEAQ